MRFRYVIGPDGSVDASDRGLAYGDGLFETMALRAGAVQRFELHWERLRLGCDRLTLPVPDREELLSRLATVARGIERGSLKLILTRGSGPRGYAPPPAPEPLIVLTASPNAAELADTISVVSLGQRLGENPALAGIKHLCRLEQVLGQQELAGLDANEGLMLDVSGRVIGGTSRNLFAVLGGTLVTPELSHSGIRGIMRQHVLNRCSGLGIGCVERAILPAELAEADELFMTNALVGIQSVRSLDGRPLASTVMAARLRDACELNEHE